MRRLAAILATFALTQLSTADDFILKHGEVIEGKLLFERTKKANEGKKSTKDMVLVIEVDDKGTVKQIPYEGTSVMSKKTSWELRKESEEWYAKESPKVKDDAVSQLNFGKQCRQRKLDDKAKIHFDKWFQLKKTTVADTGDAYVLFAKECERMGLLDHAREEYGAAYQLQKKNVDDGTADGHLKLAKWCEQVRLEDNAISEYEKALVIDPKNATANSALKRLKESEEYRRQAMRKEFEQTGRGWKISVAIEDNADHKFMEEWKHKIEELSQYFFDLTEGQFFISQCTIEDNTSNGKIIVEKGKLDWEGMNQKQAAGVLAYCKASGTPSWEVHAPGKAAVSVLAHEMSHGIFGLPDEYYQNPQCDCVMRSAPNPQKLCDSANHVGGGRRPGPAGSEGKDCWQIVLGRFKDAKHPNPNWTVNASPPKEGDKSKRAEGLRSPGGTLMYQGGKVGHAPKPRIDVIEH